MRAEASNLRVNTMRGNSLSMTAAIRATTFLLVRLPIASNALDTITPLV